jgi:WD40 repeat protein
MDNLSIWHYTADDYTSAAAWSADNNMVFVATAAGTLYALQAHSGELLYQKKAHNGVLAALATSGTALRLATAGHDGTVNLFHSQSGELLKTHKLGNFWVEHLQFSPNGKYFIAAGGKTVALFDTEGKLLWQYNEHKNTIANIDWSAHSHHFITSNYGTILFFNIKKAEPYETLQYKTSLISMRWSPDGKYIGAGTQDLKIHFWELPYEPQTDLEMSGYPTKVKHLSWSADSRYLASNCDTQIVVWNVSGKGPAGTQPQQLRRHNAKVNQVTYQNKGNLLLSGGEDGLVILWQPSQSTTPLYVGMAQGEISKVCWAYDNQKALLGTSSGDIALWDFSAWAS